MTHVFEIPEGSTRAGEAYALLDSGDARKLERFGDVVLERPDPQALWRPRLSAEDWRRTADLVFVRESDRGGRWERRKGTRAPESWAVQWTLGRDRVPFVVRPTKFKHVGLFPEQAGNWAWIAGLAQAFRGGARPRLLNLFGYTGAASIWAAKAGFDVTHVDASRASLTWTRENADQARLAPNSLRVVLEDALAFARREARRGSKYAAIVLDPPHYGRGPKGEKWQLEEGLVPLMETCRELLDERAALIISIYAVGYSPLALRGLLSEFGGESIEGELALREEPVRDAALRLLPCGFCARWLRGVDAPR